MYSVVAVGVLLVPALLDDADLDFDGRFHAVVTYCEIDHFGLFH
jgi:hypothetical protein